MLAILSYLVAPVYIPPDANSNMHRIIVLWLLSFMCMFTKKVFILLLHFSVILYEGLQTFISVGWLNYLCTFCMSQTFSRCAVHKARLNTSTVWSPFFLISGSFPVSLSLPAVWNSFTSYKPSQWWGCGAAVCGRTSCVSWFEVEMSSRSVAAWSHACIS